MSEQPAREKVSYFRHRIFKRLFLSYVLLIAFFLVVYACWYLLSYQTSYTQRTQEKYHQLTASWATAMDQQLLTAQALCSSVNTSENCRTVLQTAYVEKKTIDAMQLYRLLAELKRIKASSSSMNIYSVMLGFCGDSKIFTPGSVLSCEGQVMPLSASPLLRLGTASEVMGITGSAITLNKTYLIYAERYTGFGSSSPDKGLILVLLEPTGLLKTAQAMLPDAAGFELVNGNETVMLMGECAGTCFAIPSLVQGTLSYRAYIPEKVLHATSLPLSALLPLLLIALVGALFMVLTYQIAKRYFQPIGNISRMIGPDSDAVNSFDDILLGIRSLIGERNGYREKMITISPYAQQGMLHSLISGGVQGQQLRVLINEQFAVLRKPCFVLAQVNLFCTAPQEALSARYKDAFALITQACREMSDEDYPIVTLSRDLQNMYVIISGDNTPRIEELFYQLYDTITEALDDPAMAVTIGVSRPEDDLEQLKSACDDAENALGSMLAGGRGCVYFCTDPDSAGQKRYSFPKDAAKRMLRDFTDRNLTDLDEMLDEIYQQNVVRSDLSAAELRSLADEMHVTIRATVREAFDLSTTHIELTRPPQPATMDEILSYYRQVFRAVLDQPLDPEAQTAAGSLEQEVCDYIEKNIFSPDLSLNAVADKFGLSSKAISTLCKQHFGTTFLQYVRDRQIHRAAELLQTTDCSLESIAQQCGFTNLLTFRRNFKAVMNMNPSDFRK